MVAGINHPMPSNPRDPKEMDAVQIARRVKFLKRRMANDKAEADTLTEHLIADLRSSRG